ncbi:MAG: sporulation protein [Pelotomaculum sp.]|nr:sporulation protein [Pelotomaculum sp.]
MRLFRGHKFCCVATLLVIAVLAFLGAAWPAGAEAAAVTLTADEKQMVDLVNQARAQAGLAPLAADPVLTGLARIKAQDMASGGYFGHYSPTYGSPFDMMKKAGVRYRYAGENLARASSVSSAFKALMNSSGHRSNMLSRNYDRIGVGIVSKGSYMIVVQMFTGGQKVTAPSPQLQPQPQPQPQPAGSLNADEQKMFDLVNQERAKAGLSPLQIDMNLVKLARMKAQDMIDRGYFGHNSPTYGSPFDMMKAYGVRYSYAGENLAGAPTVESAHSSLMNSSGHRANILNANYTKAGIGVVSGGPYGKMFVQMFTG